MNWFTHMKVGSKLIFGFLVVSLIGAVIGVLGILKTSELERHGLPDVRARNDRRTTHRQEQSGHGGRHALAAQRHAL